MSDVEDRLAKIKALMQLAESKAAEPFIGAEGYKNIIRDMGAFLPPPPPADDDLVKMIGETFISGGNTASDAHAMTRAGAIAVLDKLRAEGVIR